MDFLKPFKSHFFEKYVIVIASIGQFAPYIQAYKIFALKSSYAVSFSAFLVTLLATISWFIYGLARNIKPLIISNIIALIGMSLLLTGFILY